MALISMLVIVLTVITQGFWVPEQDRGEFSKPLLTVNNGLFQAIGVISFGKDPTFCPKRPLLTSLIQHLFVVSILVIKYIYS